MLRAIAVYTYNISDSKLNFQNPNSAVQQTFFSFFYPEDLSSIKKTLCELTISDITQHHILSFTLAHNEYHYVAFNHSTHQVIVIASKKTLDSREAYYLLKNASHAVNSASLSITLDNIIQNPLGFTGKDCLIDATLQQTQELKIASLNIIEKLLERGEKLDKLTDGAVQLQMQSDTFKSRGKEQSGYCGGYCSI